jgi:hypothetical protein
VALLLWPGEPVIVGHQALPGAALIAFGAAAIGPRVIVARARKLTEWATKAPGS